MEDLLPVTDFCPGDEGITAQVRPDYRIVFSEGFAQAENIPVTFFSDLNFDSPKLARKYLGQISTRKYYPNGSKRWFYSLLFRYELLIPKSLLLVDTKKSDLSYIYYSLGGITVINNTSGVSGTGEGGWRDFQGAVINHCRTVKKREFTTLCKIAVTPSGTVLGSHEPFALDFDPVTVLMIEKYAQGLTNYNTTYKSYSRFWANESHLMTCLLEQGFRLSEESIRDIERGFRVGFYTGSDMDIYMQFREWCDRYRWKSFTSIPMEVYEALHNVRPRWGRTLKGKAA